MQVKTARSPLSVKSFLGAAIGSMIEYYDYSLFIMFLPIISPIFFTANTAYQSLSKMFVLLMVASIARPFGALFFGHLGDFKGRRQALLLSMYGIAISTFLIGVIPSAGTIGIWAALLAVTAKAVQVFCYGGEYNGAGVYVVEHAKNKREGLIGGLLSSATTCGSLLAALAGVVLTCRGMPEWAWRIGFMMGGLVGVFGILYRKNMLEVPRFVNANPDKHSLLQLVKDNPRELIAGIFIGGLSTVPATTVMGFINPVLMSKGFFSSHQLMLIQTLLNVIAIITVSLAGFFADKIKPYKMMRAACLLYILLLYPLLLLVDLGHLAVTISVLAAITFMSGVFFGPSNAFLKNLFSMQYRYRGSAISFCLGMSIFGGFTPVIENSLYQMQGRFSDIAPWMIFVSLCTYFVFRPVMKRIEQQALAMS